MTATQDPHPRDTDEFKAPPPTEPTHPSAKLGQVRLDCAALSHQGLVRDTNEDHYLVAQFGRFLKPLRSNMKGQVGTLFAEEGHAMIVADGIGGAAGGEVASDLAIRTLLELVYETPDWIISGDAGHLEGAMERIADRFRRIDAYLQECAQADPALSGMGTTMTVAGQIADSVILAHIGDSRAYLFRSGSLHQLTHDHTAAQALVDMGILQHVNQAQKRLRHVLVRCLGGVEANAEAEVQRITLADQDVLMLCSDGLTDMVDDATIAAILATEAPAAVTCQTLIDRALENGGKDNVTAIVARFGFFDGPIPPVAR